MRSRLVWPVLLIGFGLLLLLDNFDLLPGSVWGYVWPAILIVLGLNLLLSRGARSEPVEDSTTLEGSRSGQVNFKHGAGELIVHGGAPADLLYSGLFAGGVDKHLDRQHDRLIVTLEGRTPEWFKWPGPMFGSQGMHWDVRLNESVSLVLNVESGASASRLDLTDLRVTDLTIKTGASSTHLPCPPAPAAPWPASARARPRWMWSCRKVWPPASAAWWASAAWTLTSAASRAPAARTSRPTSRRPKTALSCRLRAGWGR